MKKKFAVLFGSTLLMATVPAATAFAGHREIGTPGDPNCVGQTTAWAAQVGQDVGAPGIGNIAELEGRTVKELKDAIRAYCAGAAA